MYFHEQLSVPWNGYTDIYYVPKPGWLKYCQNNQISVAVFDIETMIYSSYQGDWKKHFCRKEGLNTSAVKYVYVDTRLALLTLLLFVYTETLYVNYGFAWPCIVGDCCTFLSLCILSGLCYLSTKLILAMNRLFSLVFLCVMHRSMGWNSINVINRN